MVKEKLQVGKFYSLKTGSVDTVVVESLDGKWVFFRYANCDASDLFREKRSLPRDIFLKCYEYNKVCNVLFGEYDEYY